ncbi:hypothetical protein IFT63_10120 [Stenotrophomonas sp. CFBP 13724]|uniref:ESPR-type extended signal peptide-containing protein n=1 Tax=Stenotrophomonas sp. CFBP 13724 TaxID=2775298 RepID=UPI00177FB6E4|nr:ESPR-type extended signal peptide-containing protein [Stenotrophomonas sp. CFBP 13724]MBD8643938.1 hypothetical protein [Stenotrophomonas sp. CFBP 13724]
MNKIFSRVWSRSLQQLVVASELATRGSCQGGRRRLPGCVMAGALLLPAWAAVASDDPLIQPQATPSGGYVAVGGSDDGSDDAQAIGDASVAVGVLARAQGADATAVGSQARATAVGASAFGSNARATAGSATAVGQSARALATGAAVVGHNATVSAAGTGSVALGAYAQADAADAVALGSNALADRVGTVSVGRRGQERQITNVKAGSEATDAVNVAQLDQVKAQMGALDYIAIDGDTDRNDRASVSGEKAIAIGSRATSDGNNTTAVGAEAWT